MTSVVVKSILTVAFLMLMAAVVQAVEFRIRASCPDNHQILTNWEEAFSCHDMPMGATLDQCHLSDWINDVNGIVRFNCPKDYIITAMKGFYDASVFIRLQFNCCLAGGAYLSNCGKTISNYDDASRSVIHGWNAIDNNDSRLHYEFNMCDIVVGTPPPPKDKLWSLLRNFNSNRQFGGVHEFK